MAVTIQAAGTRTPPIGTVTITSATPGIISYTAHGLVAGDAVVFTSTALVPTGMTAGTTYYVSSGATLLANSFAVSDTQAHAVAGTNQIATTSTGTGTISMTSEVVLADVAVAGTYTFHVDTSAMASGDSIVLSIYQIVLTGGARACAYQQQFSDKQSPAVNTPISTLANTVTISVPISNELTDAGALRFTLTAFGLPSGGTPKAYPWKVLRYA